jgi:hypothetical protein
MQVYLIALISSLAVSIVHMRLEGRGIKSRHLLCFLFMHRVLGSFFLSVWPPVVLLMLGAGPEVIDANKFFQYACTSSSFH